MTECTKSAFEISIFVPEAEAVVLPADDPAVERHRIQDYIPGFNRISRVGADEVEQQWRRTVDTLVSISSTIADRSSDWFVDEIEVGLTLSAKGELLFIAEAGAEASIKFTLKRRPMESANSAVA